MDFFKMKKFRKSHKPKPENDSEGMAAEQALEPKSENADELAKSVSVDNTAEPDEEDDDDFITNEDGEEEEEGETSSAEWRDVEAEGRQLWSGFAAVYEKYCERMLFFDRLSAQQLNDIGSQSSPAPSPRFTSKKLTSPLRCLSLKKIEEPEDETEQLQQPANNPYHDLEVAYVAHVCLTWECLHFQYTQLSQKISDEPEKTSSYNYIAQQFQQFQVLLQRFVENEPFEQGTRPEIYAQIRKSLPKLLHVPIVQDKIEAKEEEPGLMVLAADLIKTIESSILTFHLFLKMDKKKSVGGHELGVQTQLATAVQQVQSSVDKKEMKLKELRKRRKGWKKKSWPATEEEVELLLSLIDVKVIRRVLRMAKISREQLFWCEEKMKKLDLSNGKLLRDPSPILFPC